MHPRLLKRGLWPGMICLLMACGDGTDDETASVPADTAQAPPTFSDTGVGLPPTNDIGQRPDDTATDDALVFEDTGADIVDEDAGPPEPKATPLIQGVGPWPLCTNNGDNIYYPAGATFAPISENDQLVTGVLRQYKRTDDTTNIAAQSTCMASSDIGSNQSFLTQVSDRFIAFKQTCALVSATQHRYDYGVIDTQSSKASLEPLFEDGGTRPVLLEWQGHLCGLVDRSASGALVCKTMEPPWTTVLTEPFVATVTVSGGRLLYRTHDGMLSIVPKPNEPTLKTGIVGVNHAYNKALDAYFIVARLSPGKFQVVRFNPDTTSLIAVPAYSDVPGEASIAVSNDGKQVMHTVLDNDVRKLILKTLGKSETQTLSDKIISLIPGTNAHLILESSEQGCQATASVYDPSLSEKSLLSDDVSTTTFVTGMAQTADALFFEVGVEGAVAPDCTPKKTQLTRYLWAEKSLTAVTKVEPGLWWLSQQQSHVWIADTSTQLETQWPKRGVLTLLDLGEMPPTTLAGLQNATLEPRECGNCWIVPAVNSENSGGLTVIEVCPPQQTTP